MSREHIQCVAMQAFTLAGQRLALQRNDAQHPRKQTPACTDLSYQGHPDAEEQHSLPRLSRPHPTHLGPGVPGASAPLQSTAPG